jgi:hypothetical protein
MGVRLFRPFSGLQTLHVRGTSDKTLGFQVLVYYMASYRSDSGRQRCRWQLKKKAKMQ